MKLDMSKDGHFLYQFPRVLHMDVDGEKNLAYLEDRYL